MDPLRTALGLYFISGLRQIDNFMSALFSSSFLQGLKVLFEQSAETEEYFFVHVKNLAFKNDLFIKLTDIKQVEKKTRFVFVFRMDDSWVETDDEPLINIAETVSNFALYPNEACFAAAECRQRCANTKQPEEIYSDDEKRVNCHQSIPPQQP